ncbi:MAG: DUF3179 domain-containing protein, partial [Bacteroidota bacterium]
MRHAFSFLLLAFGLSWTACNNNDGGVDASKPWLINANEVLNGGPGKDGIPSVDSPEFVNNTAVSDFLSDEELVVGVRIGEEVKAYPHPILDWHEIVNDEIGGEPISINYCPLTGTAMCWSRKLSTGVTTFGVSGLLYNTNLIPYDRETDSNWSQMLMQSVQGDLSGEAATLFPVVETTWGQWKRMYPDAQVMSSNTGFQRDYNQYPYGDYKTANWLLFQVNPRDERLDLKERVHGLRINGQVKTYRFGSFSDGVRVVNDVFQNEEVVIAGSQPDNFIVSFHRRLSDGTSLEFTAVTDQLPVVMQDQMGSRWDIFGRAVDGPNEGKQLSFETSLMGYWLTFGSFYPRPAIFE